VNFRGRVSERREVGRRTYSGKGFQGEVVRDVGRIVHQRYVWLEREPWPDFGDGSGSEGDVCEVEEEGPQYDGNAYHVDGNVDGVGVVRGVECELQEG
jgi:hypothetical protein